MVHRTLWQPNPYYNRRTPRVHPAGGHQFSATYNGKQNFVTSVSTNVPYTVSALNTTTELTVDHNPQVFGQNVTFTGDAAACSLSVVRQANPYDMIGHDSIAGTSCTSNVEQFALHQQAI